jgi:hypothetical protein
MKKFAVLLFLGGFCLAGGRAWGVTFGEQSTGNDSFSPDVNIVRLSQYSPPSNGPVSYLMLYIVTPAGNGRVAIYDDDPSGNTPASLVVQSSEQVLTAGWNVFPIATKNVSAGKTYWLACAFSSSPTLAYIDNDPYDYKSVTHDMAYGAYADPFVVSFEAHYNFRYCLYATDSAGTPTFTPSSSPTPTSTPTTTPTGTPSASPTRTSTGTPLNTSTATPTSTITHTPVPTPSFTPSPWNTPLPTASISPTASVTPLPTSSSVPTLLPLNHNDVVAYPSPAAKNHVWFYYYAEAGARATIDVYNAAGERVTSLTDQAGAEGYQHTHWDVQAVSPGIYLYRLTLDGSTGKRDLGLHKLVIVK